MDDALTVLTDAKDKLVLVQEETVNLKAFVRAVIDSSVYLSSVLLRNSSTSATLVSRPVKTGSILSTVTLISFSYP